MDNQVVWFFKKGVVKYFYYLTSGKLGFKAKVAIEALKGEKTLAEITSHYQIRKTSVNPVYFPVP